MKRFCYLLFFLLVLSCNREKIQPEPKPDDENPEVFVPLERIEGRVALSYVTYYSQGIPDPTLLTHICYAFAELYVVNGQYREFRLQGDESRFAAIVDLKKNHPQLKILLAFTHTVVNKDNAQGGGFSSLSSTDEGRKAFASDCLKFIEQWGIDGIDIGWEFPGISWSGHASNPASDTQNHVLLMKQLRETLGPNYLLTFGVCDGCPCE